MLFQEKELFEVKTFVPSAQVLEAQKMSNHFGFSFPTKVYSNLSFSPPSPLHSLLGVIRNFISRQVLGSPDLQLYISKVILTNYV